MFCFKCTLEKDRVDNDFYTLKIFDKDKPRGVEGRAGFITFPNLDRLRELDLVMFSKERFTEPDKVKKICDAAYLHNLISNCEKEEKFMGVVAVTRT